MTATGNGRRNRSTTVQLIVAGLVMVAIGGCKPSGVAPAPPPVKVLPTPLSGADTPIVISGGSIHFKAKHSVWTACAGTSNTCYTADFSTTEKQNTKHYQFFNDHDLNAIQVADPTNAWEIDVVDTNPSNNPLQPMQHGVLVCAESSSPFTACGTGAFSSKSIYVIAIGGTFEMKPAPPPNSDKLLFHDSDNNTYDYISSIVLDAGSRSATNKPCTNARCALFITQ